ncbi:hypothetical protein GC174_15495 [bacterium]|nr:hypothetical protein [bacterium]
MQTNWSDSYNSSLSSDTANVSKAPEQPRTLLPLIDLVEREKSLDANKLGSSESKLEKQSEPKNEARGATEAPGKNSENLPELNIAGDSTTSPPEVEENFRENKGSESLTGDLRPSQFTMLFPEVKQRTAAGDRQSAQVLSQAAAGLVGDRDQGLDARAILNRREALFPGNTQPQPESELSRLRQQTEKEIFSINLELNKLSKVENLSLLELVDHTKRDIGFWGRVRFWEGNQDKFIDKQERHVKELDGADNQMDILRNREREARQKLESIDFAEQVEKHDQLIRDGSRSEADRIALELFGKYGSSIEKQAPSVWDSLSRKDSAGFDAFGRVYQIQGQPAISAGDLTLPETSGIKEKLELVRGIDALKTQSGENPALDSAGEQAVTALLKDGSVSALLEKTAVIGEELPALQKLFAAGLEGGRFDAFVDEVRERNKMISESMKAVEPHVPELKQRLEELKRLEKELQDDDLKKKVADSVKNLEDTLAVFDPDSKTCQGIKEMSKIIESNKFDETTVGNWFKQNGIVIGAAVALAVAAACTAGTALAGAPALYAFLGVAAAGAGGGLVGAEIAREGSYWTEKGLDIGIGTDDQSRLGAYVNETVQDVSTGKYDLGQSAAKFGTDVVLPYAKDYTVSFGITAATMGSGMLLARGVNSGLHSLGHTKLGESLVNNSGFLKRFIESSAAESDEAGKLIHAPGTDVKSEIAESLVKSGKYVKAPKLTYGHELLDEIGDEVKEEAWNRSFERTDLGTSSPWAFIGSVLISGGKGINLRAMGPTAVSVEAVSVPEFDAVLEALSEHPDYSVENLGDGKGRLTYGDKTIELVQDSSVTVDVSPVSTDESSSPSKVIEGRGDNVGQDSTGSSLLGDGEQKSLPEAETASLSSTDQEASGYPGLDIDQAEIDNHRKRSEAFKLFEGTEAESKLERSEPADPYFEPSLSSGLQSFSQGIDQLARNSWNIDGDEASTSAEVISADITKLVERVYPQLSGIGTFESGDTTLSTESQTGKVSYRRGEGIIEVPVAIDNESGFKQGLVSGLTELEQDTLMIRRLAEDNGSYINVQDSEIDLIAQRFEFETGIALDRNFARRVIDKADGVELSNDERERADMLLDSLSESNRGGNRVGLLEEELAQVDKVSHIVGKDSVSAAEFLASLTEGDRTALKGLLASEGELPGIVGNVGRLQQAGQTEAADKLYRESRKPISDSLGALKQGISAELQSAREDALQYPHAQEASYMKESLSALDSQPVPSDNALPGIPSDPGSSPLKGLNLEDFNSREAFLKRMGLESNPEISNSIDATRTDISGELQGMEIDGKNFDIDSEPTIVSSIKSLDAGIDSVVSGWDLDISGDARELPLASDALEQSAQALLQDANVSGIELEEGDLYHSETAKAKLSSNPELLQRYEQFIEDQKEYSGWSNRFEQVLRERKGELETTINTSLSKDLVPAKIELRDDTADDRLSPHPTLGRYMLGTGVMKVQTDLVLNSEKPTTLKQITAHELTHLEQDQLMIRRLADDLRIDDRFDRADIMQLQLKYREATGQGLNGDFAGRVLEARNGRFLEAESAQRADLLLQSYADLHNNTSGDTASHEEAGVRLSKFRESFSDISDLDAAGFMKLLEGNSDIAGKLMMTEAGDSVVQVFNLLSSGYTDAAEAAFEHNRGKIDNALQSLDTELEEGYTSSFDSYYKRLHEQEAYFVQNKAKAHSREQAERFPREGLVNTEVNLEALGVDPEHVVDLKSFHGLAAEALATGDSSKFLEFANSEKGYPISRSLLEVAHVTNDGDMVDFINRVYQLDPKFNTTVRGEALAKAASHPDSSADNKQAFRQWAATKGLGAGQGLLDLAEASGNASMRKLVNETYRELPSSDLGLSIAVDDTRVDINRDIRARAVDAAPQDSMVGARVDIANALSMERLEKQVLSNNNDGSKQSDRKLLLERMEQFYSGQKLFFDSTRGDAVSGLDSDALGQFARGEGAKVGKALLEWAHIAGDRPMVEAIENAYGFDFNTSELARGEALARASSKPGVTADIYERFQNYARQEGQAVGEYLLDQATLAGDSNMERAVLAAYLDAPESRLGQLLYKGVELVDNAAGITAEEIETEDGRTVKASPGEAMLKLIDFASGEGSHLGGALELIATANDNTDIRAATALREAYLFSQGGVSRTAGDAQWQVLGSDAHLVEPFVNLVSKLPQTPEQYVEFRNSIFEFLHDNTPTINNEDHPLHGEKTYNIVLDKNSPYYGMNSFEILASQTKYSSIAGPIDFYFRSNHGLSRFDGIKNPESDYLRPELGGEKAAYSPDFQYRINMNRFSEASGLDKMVLANLLAEDAGRMSPQEFREWLAYGLEKNPGTGLSNFDSMGIVNADVLTRKEIVDLFHGDPTGEGALLGIKELLSDKGSETRKVPVRKNLHDYISQQIRIAEAKLGGDATAAEILDRALPGWFVRSISRGRGAIEADDSISVDDFNPDLLRIMAKLSEEDFERVRANFAPDSSQKGGSPSRIDQRLKNLELVLSAKDQLSAPSFLRFLELGISEPDAVGRVLSMTDSTKVPAQYKELVESLLPGADSLSEIVMVLDAIKEANNISYQNRKNKTDNPDPGNQLLALNLVNSIVAESDAPVRQNALDLTRQLISGQGLVWPKRDNGGRDNRGGDKRGGFRRRDGR